VFSGHKALVYRTATRVEVANTNETFAEMRGKPMTLMVCGMKADLYEHRRVRVDRKDSQLRCVMAIEVRNSPSCQAFCEVC
jgi:hypothetical protein